MDAKGDTHYRGNAVLVPTFLALYFFFSFFCTFLCGGNVGLLFSHRFFLRELKHMRVMRWNLLEIEEKWCGVAGDGEINAAHFE
jgi:hypothetical protein